MFKYSVLLTVLMACGPRTMPPASSGPTSPDSLRPQEGAMIEMIEETAVGNLAGFDVPMANVTNSYTYTLPDGSQGKGKACLLILPNADVWVGVGSEVQVGPNKWRVLKISTPENDTGSVTLEKLSP